MGAERKPRNQNLTVPNALSALRILIVPFFAWALLKGNLPWAVSLLAVSGLSDLFDGIIARKFNQVTELGKMLDPLADKLTQGVVAMCLAVRFQSIRGVLLLFIVKELAMLCCAIVLLKKKKRPSAAKWYGKVATTLFYISVGFILVMDGLLKMPWESYALVAFILLGVTAVMMLYSAVAYFRVFLEILRSDDKDNDLDLADEMRTKVIRERPGKVRKSAKK